MKRKSLNKLKSLEQIKENPDVLILKEIISMALQGSRSIESVTETTDLQIAANYKIGFSRIIKNTEALRRKVKEPYINACREIDSFFKELTCEVESERERILGLKDFRIED